MPNLKYTLILLLFAAACGTKSNESKNDSDEWPAFDAFHMSMAEAYHPLKDSANLAPAKASAEALAVQAEQFVSAELPGKVNNDEMRKRLADLKSGCRAFADKVKENAPDSVLSKDLTALHDQFHGIMEAWHGKEEHEHQH